MSADRTIVVCIFILTGTFTNTNVSAKNKNQLGYSGCGFIFISLQAKGSGVKEEQLYPCLPMSPCTFTCNVCELTRAPRN